MADRRSTGAADARAGQAPGRRTVAGSATEVEDTGTKVEGSGTMLMMIIIGALIILLPFVLGVVTAVQANARARAAADLGAIAAADYYLGGHTPEESCGVGARIVRANGAAPAGCSIASSGRTQISTRVTARLPILGVRTTSGLSRAGPVLTTD